MDCGPGDRRPRHGPCTGFCCPRSELQTPYSTRRALHEGTACCHRLDLQACILLGQMAQGLQSLSEYVLIPQSRPQNGIRVKSGSLGKMCLTVKFINKLKKAARRSPSCVRVAFPWEVTWWTEVNAQTGFLFTSTFQSEIHRPRSPVICGFGEDAYVSWPSIN